MSTISESIASYLSKQEDINEETTNNASVAFLDAYGCILGAASNEQVSSFALPFLFFCNKGFIFPLHFRKTRIHRISLTEFGTLSFEIF